MKLPEKQETDRTTRWRVTRCARTTCLIRWLSPRGRLRCSRSSEVRARLTFLCGPQPAASEVVRSLLDDLVTGDEIRNRNLSTTAVAADRRETTADLVLHKQHVSLPKSESFTSAESRDESRSLPAAHALPRRLPVPSPHVLQTLSIDRIGKNCEQSQYASGVPPNFSGERATRY